MQALPALEAILLLIVFGICILIIGTIISGKDVISYKYNYYLKQLL